MIEFKKYQGTGNDFIMIDNFDGRYDWIEPTAIEGLCDRRFGIGADGLIRINSVEGYDFELDYFNADGTKSFCGNGARCGVAFANSLGYCGEEVRFLGIDGPHKGEIKNGMVIINMIDVATHEMDGDAFIINTGSPHYVCFVKNVEGIDVFREGQLIRNSPAYISQGINVNFVERNASDYLTLRTYERGVENETFSCGTGATASAIALSIKEEVFGEVGVKVDVKGGRLTIRFNRNDDNVFTNVQLIGPAEMVFSGFIDNY